MSLYMRDLNQQYCSNMKPHICVLPSDVQFVSNSSSPRCEQMLRSLHESDVSATLISHNITSLSWKKRHIFMVLVRRISKPLTGLCINPSQEYGEVTYIMSLNASLILFTNICSLSLFGFFFMSSISHNNRGQAHYLLSDTILVSQASTRLSRKHPS